MAEVHDNPKLSERVLQRIPLRRWASRRISVLRAVYLAGAGSSWHTGAEFVIDGGYHAL